MISKILLAPLCAITLSAQIDTSVIEKYREAIQKRQMEDIRNAMSFLAGEPGIDPDHLGLLGEGVAAEHVAAIASIDARVKAVVMLKPVLTNKNAPARAERPPADVLADKIRVARTGVAPNPQFALWDYWPPDVPGGVASLSTADAREAIAWMTKPHVP